MLKNNINNYYKMGLDIWHIVLIIIIIILLIWCSMKTCIREKLTQISSPSIQTPDKNLSPVTKLLIDHIFYERLLMIAYFTDKSRVDEIKTLLINNVTTMNSYIKNYCPKLNILSNFIEKTYINNLDPYFELVYKLYDAIQNGDQNQQQILTEKINIVANSIAGYIDNILGSNIQRYIPEYMNLYVANISAFVTGDYIADTQYLQEMMKLGIDIMYEVIDHCN